MVRGRLVVLLAALPAIAHATPKPLPFTYGADTNPKGQGEVEQYIDLVPVNAQNATTGTTQRVLATELLTEVEYGVSNRVELGLYVTLAPSVPGFNVPSLIEGNGSKQRVRWRLADQGEWPIDVALYLEVAESNLELELEGKIILEKRFGKLRLLANAWFEEEFYFNGDHDTVFNPTAGFTIQVTPNVAPGVEYWMRAEVGSATGFNAGPHHYLGPTMRIVLGNFFWTTGLYMRLSNIGYELTPGVDSYGPIWFRSIVGFGFQ
jgi:hypothetical protein